MIASRGDCPTTIHIKDTKTYKRKIDVKFLLTTMQRGGGEGGQNREEGEMVQKSIEEGENEAKKM